MTQQEHDDVKIEDTIAALSGEDSIRGRLDRIEQMLNIILQKIQPYYSPYVTTTTPYTISTGSTCVTKTDHTTPYPWTNTNGDQ